VVSNETQRGRMKRKYQIKGESQMCLVLVTLLVGMPLFIGAFILHEKIVGTPMELMNKKVPWWSSSLLILLAIGAIVFNFFIGASLC